MHKFLKFIFGIKLYTFRTVPVHHQEFLLYDIYHCSVYSEKLLRMDTGTSETC